MRSPFDRFLRHSTVISKTGGLGRDFGVTRETWALSDDPAVKKPRREALATHRTASDAADLARNAAKANATHGFHQPSGAWWAADDRSFHRFVVHPDRHYGRTVLIASGLLGLGLALMHQRSKAGRR